MNNSEPDKTNVPNTSPDNDNEQIRSQSFSIIQPFDSISANLVEPSLSFNEHANVSQPNCKTISLLPALPTNLSSSSITTNNNNTVALSSLPFLSSSKNSRKNNIDTKTNPIIYRSTSISTSSIQEIKHPSFALSLTQRLTRKKPLKKSHKSKRSISMLEDSTSEWNNIMMEQQQQQQQNLTNSNTGTTTPPPPPLQARLNINDITQPFKHTVLLQRAACGYGIRISGDNPVSIESVTPNGAAHRAGVRKGDQILKINGSLATKMSHADVVRMIRDVNFVSLELLTLPCPAQEQSQGQQQQSQQQSQQQLQQQQSQQQQSQASPIQTNPNTMIGELQSNNNNNLSIQQSPTVSPIPQPLYQKIISNQQSTSGTTLVHSNSFQNHSGNLSRQITLPLPVTENTQKEFMKNQIETLQRFIQSETEHLSTLRDNDKIDKCKDKIANFKTKLTELLETNLPTASATTTSFDVTTSNISSPTIPKGVGSKTYQIRTQFGERFESDDEDSQQILSIGNEIPFTMGQEDVYQQPSYDITTGTSYGSPNNNTQQFIASKSPPQRVLNLHQATKQSKRDSNIFEHLNYMITLENIHEHSLRISKYLIQNHVISHPLLFLVTTKRIFPEIVASAARKIINNCMIGSDNQINGLKQLIQRWASQIMATWVVKESPLYFHEFSPEQMSQYDQQLSHFTLKVASRSANSGLATNPFEVFLDETREIVASQLLEYQQAIQNKQELLLTKPKDDLQATIEQLLLSVGGSASPGLKLDIRDVDPIFDQLIHSANETAVTTMAVISGLLTIGHFEFNYTSKHLLLSDVNACVSQIPTVSGLSSIVASTFNPVMKLSVDVSSTKKGNHKRNVSLPASTRPNQSSNNSSFDSSFTTASGSVSLPSGGIHEQDHYFIMVNDLTSVEYCRGKCQLTLWGDHYNYQCVKCKLLAHYWCLKQAANDHLCVTNSSQDVHVQMRHNNHANTGDNRKKRTSKTDPHKKTSVIEKLANKVSKKSIQGFYPSDSSSSSSTTISLSSSSEVSDLENLDDDENQNLIGKIEKNPSFSSGSTISITSPTIQQASMPTESSSVPRSGSFNQRRRGKMVTSSSTPRKRSDPALTSRNMSTIHGHMTETSTPPLTSAQSSGALVSGMGVFHHSASFCGDGVGSAIDNAHGFKDSNSGQYSAHFSMLNRKNMTASDSSLLSSTQTIQPTSAAHQGADVHTTNLQRQSSSRSKRGSKRSERKKTADSAIHMDGNLTSESDGESEVTLKQRTEEDPNVDPLVCDENFGPPPPLPPPSNPRSDPPPLPPRPHASQCIQKRRQIKEEIVEGEIAHFQTLKYIRDVYYSPLKKDKLLTKQELGKIFLNIRKLRSVHHRISEQLQRAYQFDNEQGDSHHFEHKLRDIFSGELGVRLQLETSHFCINQKIGNGMEIWNKKRNNTTLRALFDNDFKTKEMPDNPNARLSLQDLMGKVFQRPLRYSLLLDRLLKATPKDTEAYRHLEEAYISTKKLGDAINETTKKQELKARLEEIIRKTDSKDAKDSILNEIIEQKHELIHDGPLTWKVSKSKAMDVLAVLTNKMLLIFNRDSSGDRYYLKKMTNPVNKRQYKFDIKFYDLLVRVQAFNPSGIIVVSNSQEIFYEFDASSKREANEWIEKIKHTVEQYQKNVDKPAPVLQDINKLHGRSKSSLADMDHFMIAAANNASTSNNSIIQSPNGTLPPNFLNRPLPEVPSDSPTVADTTTTTTTPTTTTQPSIFAKSSNNANTNNTKFSGSIGNFVGKNELVDFDEVRITPKPKILKADSVNENDESVDLRIRSLPDRVERLKADMDYLLVVSDLDRHPLENDVKEKLFLDLLHMAIRVDNNNRPTREPFSELVSKSQNYIRSLNQRNSPIHDGRDNSPFNDDEHHDSTDGHDIDDQRKSQDGLQMLEDFADLQITEFENKAKSSNNSDGEEPELRSKNPFENGNNEIGASTSVNPFYFGTDLKDFEIISNITTAIVDDAEVVLTEVLEVKSPTSDNDISDKSDINGVKVVIDTETNSQIVNSTPPTTVQQPVVPSSNTPLSSQVPVVDTAWSPDSVKPKGEIFSL